MISLDELRTFHNTDRLAYARFLFQLGLDSDASKKIVSLWNWLETEGYRNFTRNSLELSPTMLRLLAAESTLCLDTVQDLILLHVSPGDYLPLMSIVGQKALSLEFVYMNREIVKTEVTKFIRRVCDQVFSDIVPPNLENPTPLLEPAVSQVKEDHGNQLLVEINEEHRKIMDVVSRTDRTLFVTFSRGYPITRAQLADYFNWKYGEACVDDIVMKDHNSGQTLYALLIVSSLSYVDRILGKRNLLQFNICGKDVRARKFIPKDAVLDSALPQPNQT